MPKISAARGGHGVPGQRPGPGPAHHRVDIGVDHAVQRVRAAGGQRAADQGGQHQGQRRDLALRGEHRRDGGDQQQFDDPRLGQRDVGADPRATAPTGCAGARPPWAEQVLCRRIDAEPRRRRSRPDVRRRWNRTGLRPPRNSFMIKCAGDRATCRRTNCAARREARADDTRRRRSARADLPAILGGTPAACRSAPPDRVPVDAPPAGVHRRPVHGVAQSGIIPVTPRVLGLYLRLDQPVHRPHRSDTFRDRLRVCCWRSPAQEGRQLVTMSAATADIAALTTAHVPDRLVGGRHASGGHRPGAGRGCGAEGRQRPPRHGDEPGAAGLHACSSR